MKHAIIAALLWGCMLTQAAAPTHPPGPPAATAPGAQGEQILFKDDFTGTREGTFPGQWKLLDGAGRVKTINGTPVLALTEGAYVQAEPQLQHPLGPGFVVELDFLPAVDGSDVASIFLNPNTREEIQVNFGRQVWVRNLSAEHRDFYPPALDPEAPPFTGRWHHAVLTYEGGKLTCYLDHFRILTGVSTEGHKPVSLALGGIATPDQPLLFRSIRITAQ